MVRNATKQVGAMEQNGPSAPYVALEFNDEGKQRFAAATASNIGKVIYIIMDEKVISAPVVQAAITDGQAVITGQFTGEGAESSPDVPAAGKSLPPFPPLLPPPGPLHTQCPRRRSDPAPA